MVGRGEAESPPIVGNIAVKPIPGLAGALICVDTYFSHFSFTAYPRHEYAESPLN